MATDTISRINESMDLVIDLHDAGSNHEALTKARTVLMLMATLPIESEFEDERLRWSTSAVEKVVAELKKLTAGEDPTSASGPACLWNRADVEYERG